MTPRKIQYMIPLLAMALIVPLGIGNAQEEELDNTPQDYTLQEINHAFEVMEPFVIYDENKNIEFDPTAINDPKVTQRDIDVALDFAMHNNLIMNIVIDHVGKTNELGTNNTELKRALEEFENGKFKALFEQPSAVGTTNEIQPTSFDFTQVPIVSIFGLDEYPIHDIQKNTPKPALMCGGSPQNPHPADSSPEIVRGFNSLAAAQRDLIGKGYHNVAGYAIWGNVEQNRPYAFAKVVTSGAPGDCNDGPFRNDGAIDRDGLGYRIYEKEPNPEVLSYVWPKLAWGLYVVWWHDNF